MSIVGCRPTVWLRDIIPEGYIVPVWEAPLKECVLGDLAEHFMDAVLILSPHNPAAAVAIVL